MLKEMGNIIIFILQMRELRHREVRWFAHIIKLESERARMQIPNMVSAFYS